MNLLCQPHLTNSILHACSFNNEKLCNIILSVMLEKTECMCLMPNEKIYKSKTVSLRMSVYKVFQRSAC